jgi:phage terminase large subunit-like protein
MGLRGKGASERRQAAAKLKPRKLPWKRKGLTRVGRVIAFLEFLPITKGKLIGRKLKLLPNQRAFIEDVYGRTASNPVRIGVLSEPRGNGKTGLVAGLALCHLLGPESEFRGECYSAAIDGRQAGLMADEIEAVILQVPEFAAAVNIQRWPYRVITVRDGDGQGSKYEVLSADARRGHGLAPSFWAYDELGQAKDRRLLDSMQTAMGKRKRSLGLVISTQAADDNHPLSELIDDGLAATDPSVSVHLLSAPDDADPFDPQVIRSVNPAFGKFLDEADVMAEAERARRMPSFETAFRNLRLNQRVRAEASFLSPDVWNAGAAPILPDIFRDGPVYGGLDLSTRTDLSALVLAAEDDNGIVHLLPRVWTPAETLADRGMRDRAPYVAWAEAGHLLTTPGKVLDYDFLAADIGSLLSGMEFGRIAYDRWRIDVMRQSLARLGVMVEMMPFGQGFQSMSPAIDVFEELAMAGRIRHGGHPLLTWCMSNAIVERDAAGNRKLNKAKSFGRIDAAVAAVMAVAALKLQTADDLSNAAIVF